MTEAERYLIKEYKGLIDTLGITDVSENKLFTWEDTINLMNDFSLHIAEQAVGEVRKKYNSFLKINDDFDEILSRIKNQKEE